MRLRTAQRATSALPVAFDGRGAVDFQRGFEMPAFDLDRYQWHLVVLGANYGTDVSVNSEFLGHHSGGYTSFLSPFPRIILQPGAENILRLVVNNELDARTIDPAPADGVGMAQLRRHPS